MKALVRIAILLMPLGLSGCLIGNGRICGPQTPMVYCDRDAYQRLFHPTPIRDEWQHPSRPQVERQQDWIACGGMDNGGYAGVSGSTGAETAKLSREKFYGIQRCMMGKGYRYTGTCEGEIPSKFPACQRPGGPTPTH
ncbi:hypothetical protein N5D13_08910 [Stenotrophomonas maltophilia]|uniref:hypothetical protein n=1 Tax=Stenotrophomonas maltophilia TaxID=40324 RepID=UPI002448C335|nr:hypothetical protein [Stenotrophomonas maltophilia]MDH0075238.1 hypothetical protein [Stenotrophomonas maltophilia]MDH0104110.1 hypothetical protein [Stenotrophomonas maltophilia]MDH0334108.1 hypothetical protein [Stenotrophomonas maltophilia]MDH0632411.1 hypothetical protein [Stenotrophomonas maltophilia]MDH0642730.1 hypothetical protein [Stenotrophomonas maltophilia]